MNVIEVPVGNYRVVRGKDTTYTEGLEACVGVALFGDRKEFRSLAHIHCGGARTDFDAESKIAEETIREAMALSQITYPKAIVVATPYELNEEGEYQNPMLFFVSEYLKRNGVEIKATDDVRHVNGIRKVHSKDMILTPEKVKIIYRNRAGRWDTKDTKLIGLR